MDDRVINWSQCVGTKRNVKYDSKNVILNVSPSNLSFNYSFENLKPQEKMIKVTNYSSKTCPVQLLPMETRYFRVGNTTQTRWLTPGSVYNINIQFIPDEPRNYNDVLKIRYLDNRILQIKVTGNVTAHFSFPQKVNFGNVPLGRAACYKIPIRSHAEKEFSFAILPSQEDACVDIYPRWGHIKPNQKPIIVMVIYRPLRYISIDFQIRIFITDLCKTPYIIHFYAYTRPGLLQESLENAEPETYIKGQPTKVNTVFRKKAKSITQEIITPKPCTRKSIVETKNNEKALLKECGYFPLYALHTINCMLISRSQILCSEHELKGPLNTYLSKVLEQRARKLKELLIHVDNYRRQMERARVCHNVKVNNGIHDISENRVTKIKIQREKEWNDYKYSLETATLEEDIFERQKARKIKQRILRISQKYPNKISTSPEVEQPFLRYCNIEPFRQAGRKVILKNRLLKVLKKLKINIEIDSNI